MRFTIRLTLAAALLGTLNAPAHAGLREAIAAYNSNDFESAAAQLAPLAEAGDAEAQFYLGYLYETGQGVERDESLSANFYRQAGTLGHQRAQFNLGLAYERGRGVEQDPAQSLEWFLKAANQGFPRAQYKAAELYLAGSGTRREPMQSYKWFKLAGSKRYEDAKRRRKTVAKELTPHQIAEADLWVRMWKEEHDQ